MKALTTYDNKRRNQIYIFTFVLCVFYMFYIYKIHIYIIYIFYFKPKHNKAELKAG